MKRLLIASIILCTGCATGYGTLAGMGVGAILGGAAAASTHDSGAIGEGIGLGALIGVAAAGVASLVAYHDCEAKRMRQEMDDLQRERYQRPAAPAYVPPPPPPSAPPPQWRAPEQQNDEERPENP